jgi:hypothetical protein
VLTCLLSQLTVPPGFTRIMKTVQGVQRPLWRSNDGFKLATSILALIRIFSFAVKGAYRGCRRWAVSSSCPKKPLGYVVLLSPYRSSSTFSLLIRLESPWPPPCYYRDPPLQKDDQQWMGWSLKMIIKVTSSLLFLQLSSFYLRINNEKNCGCWVTRRSKFK